MPSKSSRSVHREQAWQKYEMARYLLKTTYLAVQDPKLLVTILSNIHSCLDEAMSYLIGPKLTFQEKLAYLQRKGFQISFLQELNELIRSHHQSPVEFSRQEKYIICSDNYHLRYLTPGKVDKFLVLSEAFLKEVDLFLTENNK